MHMMFDNNTSGLIKISEGFNELQTKVSHEKNMQRECVKSGH